MLKKKFFKTKEECEVTFEITPDGADQVALVLDNNDWTPQAMKQQKNGTFRTKVRLPKGGQFQFRYLVNGEQWTNDDAADAYWGNEFGGENSVVFTSNGQ